MNHPKREEWAPYLFDEATAEERRKLAAHLQNCPECAAEIAGWQRSLKTLDRWKLPAARARSSQWAGPVLKWGIAAALVLGAGFGLGRLSAPTTVDGPGCDAQSDHERIASAVEHDVDRSCERLRHRDTPAVKRIRSSCPCRARGRSPRYICVAGTNPERAYRRLSVAAQRSGDGCVADRRGDSPRPAEPDSIRRQ
ncbi:MAG: hypothetical protein DME22_14045 [Verrucomicrobia bacterium]|nr:MAG: hypothetical protein DME22_14045 [Verrucomicrobiota bacterium]